MIVFTVQWDALLHLICIVIMFIFRFQLLFEAMLKREKGTKKIYLKINRII